MSKDLSVVLVDSNNPSYEISVPSTQLPIELGVKQLNVGLCIEKPNCIDCCTPVFLIKEACGTEDFGDPKDSALIYVSEKDKLLKVKDVYGNVTALTIFSFGSYRLPTNPPFISITMPFGSSRTIIPGWDTVSKKIFSHPTSAGFIQYKGYLKRAIKVDVTVNITPVVSATNTGPATLTLSVVKSDNPSVGDEIIPVSVYALPALNLGVGILFGTTYVLSGTVIFKKVKHNDYFGFLLSLNGGITEVVAPAAQFNITSGTSTFTVLPKGHDE